MFSSFVYCVPFPLRQQIFENDVIETIDAKQEGVKWSSAVPHSFYPRSHGMPRFFLYFKHAAFEARRTNRQGGVSPTALPRLVSLE